MFFPTSFQKQHQNYQPGFEKEMIPNPIYDNPLYNKSNDKLKDKVAIISGGDSGIGRAVALAYAKQGAHIAIAYLNESHDAETIQDKIQTLGRECLLIPADITKKEECNRVIQETLNHFKVLHILVNNAAVQYEAQKLEDITEAQFDKTIKTNIYGTFHMTQAALPHLKAGASIINTSSVVAFHGHDTLIDLSLIHI